MSVVKVKVSMSSFNCQNQFRKNVLHFCQVGPLFIQFFVTNQDQEASGLAGNGIVTKMVDLCVLVDWSQCSGISGEILQIDGTVLIFMLLEV